MKKISLRLSVLNLLLFFILAVCSESYAQSKFSIVGTWKTVEANNTKNFQYYEVFTPNNQYHSYTVINGVITREFKGVYIFKKDTLIYSYQDICDIYSKNSTGTAKVLWESASKFTSLDIATNEKTISTKVNFIKENSPCGDGGEVNPIGKVCNCCNGKRKASCGSCGGDGYVDGYKWDNNTNQNEWSPNSNLCVKCDGNGQKKCSCCN